jgi:hypothetical protein
MRAGDPWCSLCHLPAGAPGPAGEPAPRAAEPAPPAALAAPVPHQRSAPPSSPGGRSGRLVGGTVPEAVLASFEAGLADLSRADGRIDGSRGVRRLLDRFRGRPAMAATVGAIVVLVGLLVGMTAVGLVI